MTGTQLYWQRPTPLATFDDDEDGKSNVIFISTKEGIANALDDIHDDVRNSIVPVVVINCRNRYEFTVATWREDGTEVTSDHVSLINALEAAHSHAADHDGSVVIVDTNDLSLDTYTRNVVSSLMNSDGIHVVLAMTVAGIESTSDFLSSSRLVIDVNDKTEVALA